MVEFPAGAVSGHSQLFTADPDSSFGYLQEQFLQPLSTSNVLILLEYVMRKYLAAANQMASDI